MHETMVAESLLATISAEAEKHSGRPVRARVSCGKLNAINEEVLRFAFEAISKDTTCEAVELSVEQKPIRGRCKGCGEVFDLELSKPGCSHCGAGDFELLPDAPLMLDQIEFETEQDHGAN